MVKKKVTLGNEMVSLEMAGWNAFLLWPTRKNVFRFQLSDICCESEVFLFLWKVYNSV